MRLEKVSSMAAATSALILVVADWSGFLRTAQPLVLLIGDEDAPTGRDREDGGPRGHGVERGCGQGCNG